MKILIGADPEVFVSKDASLQPAYNLIPGDKKNPHPVDGGAVQVDGLALEFNIKPANNSTEFVTSINAVFAQLKAMVPEYEITKVATAVFDPKSLKELPEKALEIGCDPDFSGYSETQYPPPTSTPNVRYAGGHIHIGWTEGQDVKSQEHFLSCCQLARQLDYYLGLPSLMFDLDASRRSAYGRPAAFRPKPYGMEYRTLSNFWVHDSDLTEMVYKQTVLAFNQLVDKGNDVAAWYGRYAAGQIQRASKDRETAKRVGQSVYESYSGDALGKSLTQRGNVPLGKAKEILYAK